MLQTNRYENAQNYFSLLGPKSKNNAVMLMPSRTEQLILSLSYFSLPYKKMPTLNIKYLDTPSQVEWPNAFSDFHFTFCKC